MSYLDIAKAAIIQAVLDAMYGDTRATTWLLESDFVAAYCACTEQDIGSLALRVRQLHHNRRLLLPDNRDMV